MFINANNCVLFFNSVFTTIDLWFMYDLSRSNAPGLKSLTTTSLPSKKWRSPPSYSSDKLALYFPNVVVEEFTIIPNEDNNEVTINLTYSIQNTGINDAIEIQFT